MEVRNRVYNPFEEEQIETKTGQSSPRDGMVAGRSTVDSSEGGVAAYESDGKSATLSSRIMETGLQAGYLAARLTERLAGAAVNRVFEPILRQGSRGTDVAALQQKLIELGFSPGPLDGVFGPLTKMALMAFQRSRGIIVDGICGPQTRGAFSADPIPENGDIPRTGNLFIDSISSDAIRTQQQMNIPASVTIAQAILESGWGKSGLSRVANNYFGIKGTGPAGYIVLPTAEYLNGKWVTINSRFRKYHSAEESFTDHAQFFYDNGRYAEALRHTDDPYRFAREIHRAGYATAPNYSDALIKIIRSYNLTMFDEIARN
jgi:peptidoglycan hydrolase-like protein with peptidoglycan-binding domain